MSVQISSNRSVSGLYSFANDGGVVGAIGMGIFLPAKSVVKRFLTACVATLTSGGLATVSYTLVGATTTTILMVPTGVAAFTTSTTTAGVDFNANPFKTTEDTQVFFNIGAFALTAGQITFILDYNENSI